MAAPAPKPGFSKRVHAWMMARLSGRYERLVEDRKRALFTSLQGTVLEIGPGTGPNLRYYPSGIRWIGIEPNPYMHPYLERAAKRADFDTEIRTGSAEDIPADSGSVDVVVSTLVLCSVGSVAQVLKEIRRVLKPGGRFVFMEHVAAQPRTRLRRVQNWLCPLWRKIGDGCHPNRETWIAIEQAGFEQVRYEHFRIPAGPVSPQMAGFAIR